MIIAVVYLFLVSGVASQWTSSGSNIYYNTGNVGIGTSPTEKQDISGSIKCSSKFYCSSSSSAAPSLGTYGGNGDRISLWPGSTSGYPYSIGINGGVLWYSAPATASHKFYNNRTNTLTIDQNWNVGIGYIDTSYKLSVHGGIRLNTILLV